MTTEVHNVIVFTDQAGEYFLLPQELLEQGRVPAEHRVEVKRLVSETEGDDVAGHMVGTVGVLTMPTVVAGLRQLAEDSKLLDWLGQQVYSGGKA
jgi:hypothetical protein